MENYVEVFQKRWNTITNETLSSVRRQLKNYTFDISEVNRDFHRSCNEWFDGKLAPRLWYQQLEEENPEVAQEFRNYVTGIKINEQTVNKPSQWGSYVATALSLPACYCLLSLISNMGFVSKAVFSIGTAVLVWYICQSSANKKQTDFEEQIVDFFRQQLDNHLEVIMRILS
jgi:Flp pilus assembly protein TadB